MHIELAQIVKCDGAVRKFEYELQPVEEYFPEGTAATEPVLVSGSIKNFSGALLLQLEAKALLCSRCDRCLEPFTAPVFFSGEFRVSLTETNDPDTVEAVNGLLDIDEAVLENLSLALPMKRLCGENCKGLCPSCGKNLNTDSCDCTNEDIDPRLEALKNLLN